MKIAYTDSRMGARNLAVVTQANRIIRGYMARGYRLTLRQLYYQFVGRGWLPNTTRNYKRLGNIVNDGRLQGLIDWHAIEDRTRSLSSIATYNGPQGMLNKAADMFAINLWKRQPFEIEIWIEKEALAGVIERTANRFRVPFLSCRGYTSQSEMHQAAMRLKRRIEEKGKRIVILHLGDHDPSGIDMSRDIRDRLQMFMGGAYARLTFKRIALHMAQVERYDLPPNPAKTTDSRYEAYKRKFGDKSWELDAINPVRLDKLVTRWIDRYREPIEWDKAVKREAEGRELLKTLAGRWAEVAEFLKTGE